MKTKPMAQAVKKNQSPIIEIMMFWHTKKRMLENHRLCTDFIHY
jgi:hypothetical protein